MKRLALIGSKAFAEQIQGFAEETGEFRVVGFFDDFETKGALIRSLPVLGCIDDIETEYRNGIFDCVFLAAGYNNFIFREDVFNRLYNKVPFATIISPSARMGKNVTIGEGVYIGADSYVGDDSVIENNVFIHCYSTVAHNNVIGAHSYISGRFNSAGYCCIGKRVFIGICVIVSDHISISDDVWIGIGCIVVKSIKEPGKYMSPSVKLYKIE